MYEMMTGYPPFSSDDREELSDDILLVRFYQRSTIKRLIEKCKIAK
jgi:hypothetical protein